MEEDHASAKFLWDNYMTNNDKDIMACKHLSPAIQARLDEIENRASVS